MCIRDSAGDEHQRQALAQHVFQLIMMVCAVMEADDGRTADAVTDGCADEDELDIHQHAVSGNAIFSKQAQELDVVEHGHERRGDVAHEFGRAVRTGLEDGTEIKAETGELERCV